MASDAEWVQRVETMRHIMHHCHLADRAGLWEYSEPSPAASEPELDAVERVLGEPLPEDLKQFYRVAGGWLDFHQDQDLFAPKDLVAGPLWDYAERLKSYIEPIAYETSALVPSDLRPIAVSKHAIDLFMLMRPGSPTPGAVVWFAGREVDRFPSFEEYFLAMMDYNRRQIAMNQRSSEELGR